MTVIPSSYNKPIIMQETFSMIIDKNGKSLIPPPWEVRNTHHYMIFFIIGNENL